MEITLPGVAVGVVLGVLIVLLILVLFGKRERQTP